MDTALLTAISIFSLLYIYVIFQGYSNLFFEADFLHIPFLQDMVAGRYGEKNFFTTFGEHLFPGYNLILAINYFLFRIWGGFDSVIYSVSILITAYLVIYKTSLRRRPISPVDLLSGCSVMLPLLSPVNNPMWGMALAATVGTMLMVVTAIALSSHRDHLDRKFNPTLIALIPINTIFFCGGYSVGFIACMLAGAAAFVIFERRVSTFSIGIVVVCLLSLAIYVDLVARQHAIFSHDLTGPKPGTLASVQFAVVMAASSVLGKASYEAAQRSLDYFIVGGVLWIWAIASAASFCRGLIQRRIDKTDIFLMILLVYSTTTILFVSIFRVANGFDGAFGQWYNAHTKFLAVVVLCKMWNRVRTGPMYGRVIAILSIAIVTAGAVLGYVCDYEKAPYAAAWKENLKIQAPKLLAHPLSVQDQADPFKSLVWYYDAVKPGIEFLYQNHLWIFQSPDPIVDGLEPDAWMVAARDVSIVCPSGSHTLDLDTYRPTTWPQATLQVTTPTGSRDLALNGQPIHVDFSSSVAVADLLVTKVDPPVPPPPSGDLRPLVMVVSHVVCR